MPNKLKTLFAKKPNENHTFLARCEDCETQWSVRMPVINLYKEIDLTCPNCGHTDCLSFTPTRNSIN